MRKMKIGCVLFGDALTYTSEERKVTDINLKNCEALRKPITEDIIRKVREVIEPMLPSDCESFFTRACSENEVIDLPEADVYVAVPFQAPDLLYAALYAKNKPVVFSLRPYGEVWSYGAVYYPYFVRDARKMDAYIGLENQVFVSKNPQDLHNLLNAIHVKYKVNHTKALCIGEVMYEPFHSWNWGYEMIRAIQQKFGIEFHQISSQKFLELYHEWNQDFDKGLILKEVSNNRTDPEQDTAKSEKMYHVFKELIQKYEADAFTVNCLYSVVHTGCKTSSCYSLSKLNDEGIVSTCEADITTMMNMIIVTYASGGPAFMLNPYLFPEDNILYASHCTSPRKHSFESDIMDDVNIYPYFEIPELPCGLQIMKESGPVTVTGLSHDKMDEMIIIKGRIIRNTAFPSCRTQIELEITGDIKDVAEQYQGRHWALVYGDQSEKIRCANRMLGIETKIF